MTETKNGTSIIIKAPLFCLQVCSVNIFQVKWTDKEASGTEDKTGTVHSDNLLYSDHLHLSRKCKKLHGYLIIYPIGENRLFGG